MLKAAVNSIRKYRGEDEMTAGEFLKTDQKQGWAGGNETRVFKALGQRRFLRRWKKA